MEIIAQATIGLSKFLHPDYVSAAPRSPIPRTVDFFDGQFTITEFLILTYLGTGILLLGLVITHFVSVLRKRT